eukprot:c42296_g1_i1 orf=34-243(+)
MPWHLSEIETGNRVFLVFLIGQCDIVTACAFKQPILYLLDLDAPWNSTISYRTSVRNLKVCVALIVPLA